MGATISSFVESVERQYDSPFANCCNRPKKNATTKDRNTCESTFPQAVLKRRFRTACLAVQRRFVDARSTRDSPFD